MLLNLKIFLAAIAVASMGVMGYGRLASPNQGDRVLGTSTKKVSKVQTVKSTKKVAKKFISSVKVGSSMSVKTGKLFRSANVFSVKEPAIYVQMNVAKPPKGTDFEYTRYYNEKYLDHGSLKTTKKAASYVSFSWKLKTKDNRHLPGRYRIKLYTNGNFEREVSFTVK